MGIEVLIVCVYLLNQLLVWFVCNVLVFAPPVGLSQSFGTKLELISVYFTFSEGPELPSHFLVKLFW